MLEQHKVRVFAKSPKEEARAAVHEQEHVNGRDGCSVGTVKSNNHPVRSSGAHQGWVWGLGGLGASANGIRTQPRWQDEP